MGGCKKIGRLIGPYAYGDLTPREMNLVRRHLESCSRCAEEFKDTMKAVEIVPRDLPALSEEEMMRVTWAVKGAIGEQRKASSVIRRRSIALGLAAAGISAIAVGASVMFRDKSQPPAIVQQSEPQVPSPSPDVARDIKEIPDNAVRVTASESESESPTVLAEEPDQPRVTFGRAVSSLMSTASRRGNSVERLPGDVTDAATEQTAEPLPSDEGSTELAIPPVPDTPNNAELLPEHPE